MRLYLLTLIQQTERCTSSKDSTLPSPGAADDAMPAALMLDTIRVLLDTPSWSPTYSILYREFIGSVEKSHPLLLKFSMERR